jgi:DNA polymerase I
VLTTVGEVQAAVRKLLDGPAFCFDVETLGASKEVGDDEEHWASSGLNPHTNSVIWIGLGGPVQTYLIPMGHPNGRVLEPAHTEKVAACLLYPEDDERHWTKATHKPSWRMVDVPRPTVYAPAPPQLTPREVFDVLEPLMFSDRAKVGHNLKFDLQSVAKYFDGEIPPGPYHDTIILRHVLNEDLTSYKLKPLVWDPDRITGFLGVSKERYPELGAQGVENFGLDEAARYLCKDVRYCWWMFQHFHRRLGDLRQVYEFEMSLYPILMQMEFAGFPVDRGNMAEVKEDLEHRIAEIEQWVYKAAGGEFVLSNTNARRWVMFGQGKPSFATKDGQTYRGHPLKSQKLRPLGYTPASAKTTTKLPQITQAVLEFYRDRGNQMAERLLDWSLYEKLRGTFIEGLDKLLTEHQGRLPTLHTSFNQHGTKTGRLSSTRPNLQNLPRGSTIRDLFVADEGYVLIVADYDQIELRCLAHEAQELAMIEVFMQRRDIHQEAAAAAMRLQAALITADQRQVGKTLNFATGYGAGPARIAAVAGVSLDEGKQFLDRYYRQYPRLQPWKAKVLREARARLDRADPTGHPPAVVIPPFGRLRRLPELDQVWLMQHEKEGEEGNDWRRWRAERQAVNAVIQGFASYITKLAMIDLQPMLAEYDAQMVGQVHDEIILRVRAESVDDVLPRVVSTMGDIRGTDGQPILGNIPLVVSAETGYTWAEAKGK